MQRARSDNPSLSCCSGRTRRVLAAHTHQLRIQEQFSHWALLIAVRVRICYQKIFIALILITAGQQCWHDDFQLFVFVKQVIVITRQACEEGTGKGEGICY